MILPANNLIGTVPDLTGLTFLSTLILNNNNIQLPLGALPRSLIELDISSSIQQSGSIPDFSSLVLLTHLNLSNNSLLPPSTHISPLPKNLLSLDLGNNIISDPDTGAIPRWLLPDQLGDSIVFVNLSLNYFCGFLPQDFIPSASAERLDLSNNSFFCPLPTFNSSLVSADCESLYFRSISPASGPTYNHHDDPKHVDTRVLRIYADGLSDYEDCTSLSWRCRMTFINSSESFIYPGDWVPEDNCILCRPLPTTGVGLLQVVIELLAQDGKRSAGVSDVPVDIWLPVIESTVLYCQVRMQRVALSQARLTRPPSTMPLYFHPSLPLKL